MFRNRKLKETSQLYYLYFDWNTELNVSDFYDSFLYKDRHTYLSEGYYNVDDKEYFYIPAGYNSNEKWYRYDDDYSNWDEVYNEELPEVFDHKSAINDFWQTETWIRRLRCRISEKPIFMQMHILPLMTKTVIRAGPDVMTMTMMMIPGTAVQTAIGTAGQRTGTAIGKKIKNSL